jgi:hypothetical protein
LFNSGRLKYWNLPPDSDSLTAFDVVELPPAT